MDETIFLSQIVAGLSRSMLLFFVGSGLTVIFGLLKIFNFAHGALYMLSAYLGFTFAALFGSSLGLGGAVVVIPIVVALFGIFLERVIIKRIYEKEFLLQLIVTYALSLIVAESVLWAYGGNPRSIMAPEIFRASFALGKVVIPYYQVFLIIIGIGVAFALWYVFQKTNLGWTIEAAVTDRAMASALGIPIDLLYALTFGAGCWLAGVAGVLSLPISAAAPGMDASMGVETFAVVIIGGLGNIWGTFAAALLIGLVESLGVLWLPRGSIVFVYVLMLVVLMLRPQGLFGRVIRGLK
jgi:branched-chain amino acid transport system permease protein